MLRLELLAHRAEALRARLQNGDSGRHAQGGCFLATYVLLPMSEIERLA